MTSIADLINGLSKLITDFAFPVTYYTPLIKMITFVSVCFYILLYTYTLLTFAVLFYVRYY